MAWRDCLGGEVQAKSSPSCTQAWSLALRVSFPWFCLRNMCERPLSAKTGAGYQAHGGQDWLPGSTGQPTEDSLVEWKAENTGDFNGV